MSRIEQRLKELNIVLPEIPGTMGAYLHVQRCGDMLYTSGGGPLRSGKAVYTGKVGVDLTLDEGRKAAELSALYLLSTLRNYLGDLDKIEKTVKVLGFVASAPSFYDQPLVLDGFSMVWERLLGEDGRHARSAIAVPQLPFNTPVEVEMILVARE